MSVLAISRCAGFDGGRLPAMQRTRPDSVRRAVARIRQLSCLGLGGEAAVPEMLRELHGLVPAGSNIFAWAGAAGEITNVYTEHPGWVHMGPLYFAEFYERREREVILTFSESMRLRDGPAVRHVDSFLKVDRREFLRSAMFNEILRQVNDHQRLFVAVREGVRGLGGMLLGRGQHDPPFYRGRGKKRLELVVPHIAHALAPTGNLDVELADTEEEGLIVAGLDGEDPSPQPASRKAASSGLLSAIFPGSATARRKATLFCRRRSCAYAKILSECSRNGPRKMLRGTRWRPGLASPECLGRFYLPGLLANGTGRRPEQRRRFWALPTVHKLGSRCRCGSRAGWTNCRCRRENARACLLMLSGHSRATIAGKNWVLAGTRRFHIAGLSMPSWTFANRAELVAKVLFRSKNVFGML